MDAVDARAWAKTYRDAAAEHLRSAAVLRDAGRFAPAHYLAGLAVECILRAHRMRHDPAFDARHDLSRLYVASGLPRVVPPEAAREVSGAMAEVVRQWRSDHRYRSEAALRTWMHAVGLDMIGGRYVKGDYLKYRTSRLIEAASRVVNLGDALWNA